MNFRKVWTIARHEYLVNVRRPGFLIMTGLVPLLGVLLLLIAAFASGKTVHMLERVFVGQHMTGVVDESGLFTPILPDFAKDYQLYPDESSGREALAAKEISRLIIIPGDYLDSGKITVITASTGVDMANIADSQPLKRFFIAHLARGVPDPRLRARLVAPYDPTILHLNGETESETQGPFAYISHMVVPYVLSILLIMTIFVSSSYLLRGVSEEKTNRIIEILLSSVTADELLAGKVMGLGALGLTQIVIWVVAGFALSGGAAGLLGLIIPLFDAPGVFLLAILYYLLGFLMYAVLMGSVGALGSDMQEAQQLAAIFSMLAAVPLMFAGVLFSNPDSPIFRVISWFPLTAPTAMMLRLPLTNVPLVDIVGSLVLILITIPFVLWLGARLFRLGILMYGKRPSVREIWHLLRMT